MNLSVVEEELAPGRWSGRSAREIVSEMGRRDGRRTSVVAVLEQRRRHVATSTLSIGCGSSSHGSSAGTSLSWSCGVSVSRRTARERERTDKGMSGRQTLLERADRSDLLLRRYGAGEVRVGRFELQHPSVDSSGSSSAYVQLPSEGCTGRGANSAALLHRRRQTRKVGLIS